MTALRRRRRAAAKIGVHPRPADSFAHAMPALLRDAGGARPARDKWVAGFPATASGLPAIHALVILNDADDGRAAGDPRRRPDHRRSGRPRCRGVAIARFGPRRLGRPPARRDRRRRRPGPQPLEVVGHVLPGVELVIFDRHPDRAADARRGGRGPRAGIAAGDTTADGHGRASGTPTS